LRCMQQLCSACPAGLPSVYLTLVQPAYAWCAQMLFITFAAVCAADALVVWHCVADLVVVTA
jgi:hypothetical protein